MATLNNPTSAAKSPRHKPGPVNTVSNNSNRQTVGDLARASIAAADHRLGPYLVDGTAATCTLDEAIGALTLAYEAVNLEAGTNETLSHAFGCIRLAIGSLDTLRDTLSEAEPADVVAYV